MQQYDASLRKHVSYIFSDDGLQSCPPGKLRAMLDEDENTLFLPLASVIDIKKIKELLKNEPDKVEACRAAIDAAEPGTLICRVEDHEQGPRVVRTQDLPDEVWACASVSSFCSVCLSAPRRRSRATARCRRSTAEPTAKSRGRPRGLRLIPRPRLAAVESPASTPPSRHRRDPPRHAGSSSRTPPAAAPSP